MLSAGQLTIRAHWSASGLSQLEVALQRPPVTQLFIGQTPAAVVKSLPLIYTLCAEAQAFAGQAALAAAAGEPVGPADHARLWIELLHENFWRLLLDWPPALGLPPASEAFIAWRAARYGANCVAATDKLLSITLPELAEKCLEKCVDRDAPEETRLRRGNGTPYQAIRFQPEQWLAYFQEAGDLPLAVPPASIRLAFEARLATVATAASALMAGTPYPLALAGEGGCGVAQTVTARGVLTHAVRLAAGKVEQYRVWAPTDAFFTDAQALSSLLDGAQFASLALARQAIEQSILALDPCLPYTVELSHA